jgi:hypothetical protein
LLGLLPRGAETAGHTAQLLRVVEIHDL